MTVSSYSSPNPPVFCFLQICILNDRGVARNLFGGYKSFWGWIKLLNSRSAVILPHKKFTWADFGGRYKYRYPPPSLRPC